MNNSGEKQNEKPVIAQIICVIQVVIASKNGFRIHFKGYVNACEIKWCNGEYEITKSYNTILQNKINTFIEESKVKSPVHLTMITTNGVKNNIYQDSFQTQVTLNDLFL